MEQLLTDSIKIDSGASLLEYLSRKGLRIDHFSGIEGSQNYIILPDKTSFNWKSRQRIVRVNCKENAKDVIEARTNYQLIENGKGDPTRRYSLLIDVDNLAELDAVIEALKSIEGNMC